MSADRITESQLVLPSLFLMVNHRGNITTSQLIEELTSLLKPEGIDAEILNGRNDTYFSQKVRNLKSHDTFEREGLATYTGNGFSITTKGRLLVKQNKDNIKYLTGSNFTYDDVRRTFGNITKLLGMHSRCYSEIITEGSLVNVSTKTHVRSQKLRDAAIEHFTSNGIIKCDCCGFEFSEFYGHNYGSTCIEIHHLKPIFSYEDDDVSKTIDKALLNLLPVCPNCHRVIHKNRIDASQIPQFKIEINSQRVNL